MRRGHAGISLHVRSRRDSFGDALHPIAVTTPQGGSQQGLRTMDYELLIVRGRASTEAIKLAEGVTTVGRQDDCQLRIKSSQVSRKHCEIFEKKGMLLVKDLGSSNGTFVNGKRIQDQRVLEPGDELTIGQVKLRVAKIGEPPPPPRTKPGSKKPGDTDIMGALGVAESGGDEFEIEYDGEPEMLD